jgi:hypothetical protein
MSFSTYEIPLVPGPQRLSTVINGRTYLLRVLYANEPEGGYFLDISAADGTPLVAGLPLVTGCDLLEQYAYLGLGVGLYVYTDGEPDATPTFDNLGATSHLVFTVST